MRFFLDNNLSPHLARALNALCEPEDIQVTHLRDRFDPNVADRDWINALASEKHWVVITRDRLIKNPLEKEALRLSGLTVFVLVQAWSHHAHWILAAQLVRWFPRLIEQAGLVTGGAVFEVPWNLSGKGKFKQLRL